MPRPTTLDDEDENALRAARRTRAIDRGTQDRTGEDRMYAQFFPPWVEPIVGGLGKRAIVPRFSTPRLSQSPRIIDQLRPVPPVPRPSGRRRKDKDSETYSAAFRPDFFPNTSQGYDAGEARARELRDYARRVQRQGWGTAVLIVERQRANGSSGSRFLVAGVNGSFNPDQLAVLDQLGIRERFNLRDKTQTQGHPDVVITFGQIGAIDSSAVAIGSSIPFCPVCEPQISGAGFELVSDFIIASRPARVMPPA